MKKILLGILVIILLSAGVVVGLILVQQNQVFKQKASSPTGTANVSISPATSSFQRNTPYTISVYFNAGNISMSGLQVRLTYNNLAVKATALKIDSNLLSSGDWLCPVQTITAQGSTDQIDIACANTSPAGYTNSSNTLLATFTFTASQVPSPNPLIISFDPEISKLTQKSDGTDILLTPASTGSYTILDTIAGSPTVPPVIIPASPTATPTLGPTLAPGATATPTASASATPSASPTATASATPIGQTPGPTNPPIPVTGFDAPTMIGAAAGIILLLFGAAALIL